MIVDGSGKTKTQLLDELAVLKQRLDRCEAAAKPLRENAERYEGFFDQLPIGCFEIDLQGKFTYVNRTACVTLGYTKAEFLCLSLSVLHSTRKEEEQAHRNYYRIYETGVAAMLEYPVRHRNGVVLCIVASVLLIRNPAGVPVGSRGVVQDVTQRNRLGENEEKLTKQLQQA